jgi:hypothetical protein
LFDHRRGTVPRHRPSGNNFDSVGPRIQTAQPEAYPAWPLFRGDSELARLMSEQALRFDHDLQEAA